MKRKRPHATGILDTTSTRLVTAPVDAAQAVVDLLPALVAHAGGAPEDIVGVDGALDGDAVFLLN